jgi:hypothetical protein
MNEIFKIYLVVVTSLALFFLSGIWYEMVVNHAH